MPGLVAVYEYGLPTPPTLIEDYRPRIHVAPYDEITGLPHLLAPSLEKPDKNSPDTSWHHALHPGKDLLEMGEVGFALRSFLQLLPNDDHNVGPYRYHKLVAGTKVPESYLGKIRMLIFKAANTVTDQVLDVREGEARTATADERQRLLYGDELRTQIGPSVRRALTRFTTSQGLAHLTKVETRQYKNANDDVKKKEVVDTLLEKFMPDAFRPINERYEEASRRGYLPDNAPASPAEVARPHVFNERTRYAIFDEEFNKLMRIREAA